MSTQRADGWPSPPRHDTSRDSPPSSIAEADDDAVHAAPQAPRDDHPKHDADVDDSRDSSPNPANPAAPSAPEDDGAARRSVTITEPEGETEKGDGASDPGHRDCAGSSETQRSVSRVDQLSTYRRSLELLERREAKVQAVLAELNTKTKEECPGKPFVTPYAQKRVSRSVEDVAQSNDDWLRQRRKHIEKKAREVEREERATLAAPRVDAKSERLCQMTGRHSVYHGERLREESEGRKKRLAKVRHDMEPPFRPEHFGWSSEHGSTTASYAPPALPERSRSAAALRLSKDADARKQRKEERARNKVALDEEEEARRSSSAPKRRSRSAVMTHVSRLISWKENAEARRELRGKAVAEDPEATFQPRLSESTARMAEQHRGMYGHSLVPPTDPELVARAQRMKRRGSPDRDARGKVITTHLCKMKPLPKDFWTRNNRALAAKTMRAEKLRTEIDSRNRRDCTFAPRISAVSHAIMEQSQRMNPESQPGPHYMQPTDSAEQHFAGNEHREYTPPTQHLPPAHVFDPTASPLPASRSPSTTQQQPAAASASPHRGGHADPMAELSALTVASADPQQARAGPSHHSVASSSVATSDLDARMAEMRATLDQWNMMANAV